VDAEKMISHISNKVVT